MLYGGFTYQYYWFPRGVPEFTGKPVQDNKDEENTESSSTSTIHEGLEERMS